MPQYPLYVACAFEQLIVLLSNGSNHYDCEDKIKAEKYNTLERLPFLAMIRLVKDHCDTILAHAQGNTVLEALPAHRPRLARTSRASTRVSYFTIPGGVYVVSATLNRGGGALPPMLILDNPRVVPRLRFLRRMFAHLPGFCVEAQETL